MSQFGQYSNYDGGFNAEDAGGFSNGGGFNNTQSGSQKAQLRQSITPVTLKQIAESNQPVPDGEYRFEHLSLNLVSFVGVLRRVDGLAAGVNLTVEDGTGSMDIKMWFDDKESSLEAEIEKYSPLLNKYVYVAGSLRTFGDKRTLQFTTVLEVTDHNQVVHHFLDAISVYSKGITKAPAKTLFVELGGDSIFDIIKEFLTAMQEGVPIQFLAQKTNLSVDEVKDQVQLLIDAGNVYTGHDDTSYLAI